MLALRVVEHLNVLEHVLSGGLSGCIGPSSYPLALEELKEALGNSVVMAVPASAHAGFEIMLEEECPPFAARKPTALVRVNQDGALRLPAPDAHEQRLYGQFRCHAGLHRPANDAAGEEVDDDG